ncbi:anti-sigma factor [Microvirga subterranea]|uniref:Anti-sigma-K factor RskA n=1 Tax=Microvirga subterranea TaxID=186651 RepID=A0A370HL65_9HYPH|nr:anti-sigma factor [Microvirga subterranea]RDI59177.1 anti-sigma-K factor RskA [Microvirga subterranea]
MRRDDFDRLAAEHVLGLLEGEERGVADNLLASDGDFRNLVELWRQRFSAWDETADELPAGDALWARIESSVSAAPVAAPRASAASRPASPGVLERIWESLSFWRTVGLAGAAAALLMGLGMGFFAIKASRQPVMIAVLLNDANQPGAVLSTFEDGRMELVPLGDMTIPHNHSVQVWTFPDPAGPPVSVGVLRAARTARMTMDDLPQPHSNQLFTISVEPLAGSPTGLPTGPVVMKGTASAAL